MSTAWAELDPRALGVLRGLVALSGAAILTWDGVVRPGYLPDTRRRLRDASLALLGLASFACWWNLGLFHFELGYLQVNDLYHYYLGAKYTPELGYTRLYECTAVADAEDGNLARVRSRWMRDLATNELTRTTSILSDPGRCKSRFSAARWDGFRRDVSWFRSHATTPEVWDTLQVDHGYNATPVWGAVGSPLANLAPASDSQMLRLALIDPVLLLVMWGAVWWAFGWRSMAVALLWWGTNYPARFAWTGGAFLRADWLALTVVGICLVKKGLSGAGGFALTYAALLRLFPAIVVLGLVLKVAADVWLRRRSFRLTPDHRRFAFGALLALLVLIPGSIVTARGGAAAGVRVWSEFVDNTRKHYATPLTNNIGLKVLIAYDPATRVADLARYSVVAPLDSWMAARRRVFGERAPIFWLLVAAFLWLTLRAVRDQPDWIALVLGVALLPVTLELTCYYYAILLVLGLLWPTHRWVGVGLCALAAFSNLVPAFLKMDDDIYAAISVATVAFALGVTALLAQGSGPKAQEGLGLRA